jgi:nicotinamidase-related amidase
MANDLLTTLGQKAAPERAALLVIDVQNDFVAENGFFQKVGANIAAIQRAVPPLVSSADVIDAWQTRQRASAQTGTHAHV